MIYASELKRTIGRMFKRLTIPFFIAFVFQHFFLHSEVLMTKEEIKCQDATRSFFWNKKVLRQDVHYSLVIFLHGLIDAENLPDLVLEVLQKQETAFEGEDLIFIFPVGLKGAFSEQGDRLGWWPNFLDQNSELFENLVKKFKNTVSLDKVVLGGFSNGAYLTSHFLQSHENTIFDAFWIQGGGYVEAESQLREKQKKAVIEVGVDDIWHYDTVKNLGNHLMKNQWHEGQDFLFRELENGHELNLNHLRENLEFLLNKNEGF